MDGRGCLMRQMFKKRKRKKKEIYDSCHDPLPRVKVSHLTSSTYNLNHCTISFPI